MKQVLLGLGSSIGHRKRNLQLAFLLLENTEGINIINQSSVWGSLPLGEAHNIFLNMVISIETVLSPQQLLQRIAEIEEQLERKRGVHWSDRSIDIDILLFGEEIIVEEKLIIPHKEMLNRSFVMCPAKEIAKEWRHPIAEKSLHDLGGDQTSLTWKKGRLF